MAEDARLRRIGMREVARAAGVSVSTVANVLSRPSLVAPETRERVEHTISRIGYVRNGLARQLRGLPSPIVGSIILDLANPYYAELNRGMEDRLAEVGCLVLACSTDHQSFRERQLLGVLEEQAVRGVIISPADPTPAYLLETTRRGTPVVLIDHPRGDLDLCSVTCDNGLGGRLVGEHLLSLGHRRIAYLGSTVVADGVNHRREGLRRAMASAGLDPAEALVDIRVITQPPPLVDAAAAAVEQVLAATPRPTALVCLNDTAALGAMLGLEAAGMRVPADISVVGYDDLVFAARLSPSLTTVAQPVYQIGCTAAEVLLDEERPDHAHQEIRFTPKLVVRSSTGPPPGR